MPVTDNKFESCAEDDPLRCQGTVNSGTKAGQCPYKSVQGGTYCPMHGGIVQQKQQARIAAAQYRLQQYQERVQDFATNPEVKNLREEIGIMRMMLEGFITKCKTMNDLVLYTDKITQMVNGIQKLVESAQRMEEKTNSLLDRKVVIVIADSIVTLIGQYINDPDQLNEIGVKICESITRAASPAYSSGSVTQSDNKTEPLGV